MGRAALDTDRKYDAAIEALQSLPLDLRVLAVADSVQRDYENAVQRHERAEREVGNKWSALRG